MMARSDRASARLLRISNAALPTVDARADRSL